MVGSVLSRLWTDCCTVLVRETVQGEDGTTAFREHARYTGLPCRLSYSGARCGHAEEALDGAAAKAAQEAKLILPRDVDIPPGSRILVKREDRTMDFHASGIPRLYRAHQEILLENREQWA